MANEFVKYHNDLIKLGLKNFNATELDLFMAICNSVKDKGTEEIVLNFSEIKHLTNYKKKKDFLLFCR